MLRDVRDGAALALGWGGCRPVFEVVGLDWQKKGPSLGGRGFLAIDAYGLRITLLVSKTSQDVSKEFLISRHDAPRLCAKVEEWIVIAGIAPGAPVLRPIVGKDATERMVHRYTWIVVQSKNSSLKGSRL